MATEARPTPLRFERIEDYLEWARTKTDPGRTELDDVEVVAVSPETVEHVRTKGRVYTAMTRAIAAAKLPCEALPDGATVRISRGTAYEPDALVFCGPAPPAQALTVENPVVVVEVVSPSSGARDSIDKMPAYFQVPSVMHYLLVQPIKRFVVHFRRGEENAPSARIHYNGEIVMDPPGLTVTFDELLPAA